MNQLEILSNKNRENYQRYLRRMTESMKCSTKGLIPLLAKDSKNILDVGCGSGVMLKALEDENPKAKLTGIDLNIDSIDEHPAFIEIIKQLSSDECKMIKYLSVYYLKNNLFYVSLYH